VHPFACTSHVSRPPLAPHWWAPLVHAFTQQDAAPALPVHAPPVHASIVDTYQQLCESWAHETSAVALALQ